MHFAKVTKVSIQQNCQVGDNNTKIYFETYYFDCERFRANNQKEV